MRLASVGLIAVLFGCSSPEEAICSRTAAIVGGAERDTYLELTQAQSRAVVGLTLTLDGEPTADACSGVVVGPGVILTAAHCGHGLSVLSVAVTFEDSNAVERRSEGQVLATHPTLDLMILGFGEDALNELSPLPIAERVLEPGDLVQLAGLGRDDAQVAGRRRFAVEEVIDTSGEFIAVRGDGESGACAGDSGGPLLVRDSDGRVAVAGVLSDGSVSCGTTDRYARLSGARDWLAAYASAARIEDCGTLAGEGRCFDDIAVWCDQGRLAAEDCGDDVCGWSRSASGWRCIERDEDACSGVGEVGICAADLMLSCRRGTLQELSCGACGATCRRDPSTGAARCVEL